MEKTLFHDHFCICEKSLLRLLKIAYVQFDQFLHPQQYLPQQVPCIAVSLPRMSIQHQLINQKVQVATTGRSRHSSSPMEESPGLSKILAWRLPARPCQVTDSPYLTIICCFKSAHCLVHERLNGDCLDLPGN